MCMSHLPTSNWIKYRQKSCRARPMIVKKGRHRILAISGTPQILIWGTSTSQRVALRLWYESVKHRDKLIEKIE